MIYSERFYMNPKLKNIILKIKHYLRFTEKLTILGKVIKSLSVFKILENIIIIFLKNIPCNPYYINYMYPFF